MGNLQPIAPFLRFQALARRGVVFCCVYFIAAAAHAALLPAPTSIGPTGSGISTTPTFSWSAVTGANRYWLVVSTNAADLPTDPNANSCPGCVNTGLSGVTTSTSFTAGNAFPISGTTRVLSAGTTYYWRVQAFNTNGTQGSFSSQKSFTTASSLLAAPTAFGPTGSGISTTPTFSWSSVTGANRYWLVVSTNAADLPTNPTANSCPGCVNTGLSGVTTSTSFTAGNAFPISGTTRVLSPGTTYYWRIQAFNSNGTQGNFSSQQSFTTASSLLSAPIPIGPIGTGIPTAPIFSWSSVTGANRYWLVVSTNAADLPTDPNANSCPGCVNTGLSGVTTSTSFTAGNAFPISGTTRVLSPGTTYYWRVQAFNSNGTQGNFSSQQTFSTQSSLLAAPNPIGPIGNGIPTTPIFSWSSVTGANRYWLVVSTNAADLPTNPTANSCPGCVNTGLSGVTTSTSFTAGDAFPISGTTRVLSPGTTYYWRVQAFNSNGTQGNFSSQQTFTTQSSLLAAPTAISPIGNGIATTPTFSWSSVIGADRYWLTVSTNAADLPTDPNTKSCTGCVNTGLSGNTNTTTFTAGNAFPNGGTTRVLSPNTTYYWKVQGYSTNGTQGFYSSQQSFTTAGNLLPAPTPSSPSGNGIPTTPTFNWSSVQGATSYRLMVATSTSALPSDASTSSCSSCVVNTTPGTNYYIPSSAFSASTTYYWQVQAKNTNQNGAWSNRLSFGTASPNSLTITGLNPSPVTGSNTAQALTIYGTGFQFGMTATLNDTTNGGGPYVKSTSSLTSTQASISANVTTAAAMWTVKVTNPNGSNSGTFLFRVLQPSDTGGTLPVSRIAIDTIASPQTVGSAFAITLRTLDAAGAAVAVSGDLSLRTTVGTVSPSVVRLVNGVASASVKLDSPSCDARLEAVGAGSRGTSNAFVVQGSGQGTLTGRVTTIYGTPLQGATVTFTGCGGNPIALQSGPLGNYTTQAMTAGPYTASATYNGASSRKSQISVAANSCSIAQDLKIDVGLGTTCNPTKATPILFVPGIMGSTTGGDRLYPSLPIDSPTQGSDPPYYTPDHRWSEHRLIPVPNLNGLYMLPRVPFVTPGVTRWDLLAIELARRNSAYGRWEAHDKSGIQTFIPKDCLIIPVPYDWRMRPEQAAVKYLIPRIKDAMSRAGMPKVHIVAHSMGGDVVRAYLQSSAYVGDVDSVAILGTPSDGAEKAYLLVEGGNPRRADAIGSGGVYTHVSEHLFEQAGAGDLASLQPISCRKAIWDLNYQAACTSVRKNFEDPEWNEYRKAMSGFFRKEIQSMRALMPLADNFLRQGSAWRGAECGEHDNKFLRDLNAAVGSLSGIRLKTFAGTGEETIHWFDVAARRDCSQDVLSPDGEYLRHESDTDGDGTVRRTSVVSVLPGTTEASKTASHVELIELYRSEVAAFLFNVSANGALDGTADERSPAIAAPTASITAPDVQLGIAGRARPYVTNGAAQGCGLKPSSTETDQTLPGCVSVIADPLESAVMLAGLPNGTYTLKLTSTRAEDSSIAATIDDGTNKTDLHVLVFCEVGTRQLTMTVAAGSAIPIRIDGPVAPATAMIANATASSPRTTVLSWSASTTPNVAGYNVYSRKLDEPKLTLLAQVNGTTSYTTTDVWADASGVPIRTYAVAARLASGETSVLTELARNDDRDHDGLSDVDESRYNTDANVPDSDGDGLKDGDEVASGSDPLNADTDGDGFPDGLEVARGSDPLAPGSTPVVLRSPANLVAEATSTMEIALVWNAVTGVTTYQVFRSSNHGDFVQITSTSQNSFTDTGRTPGTSYLYQVRAVDSADVASPYSNVDIATTIIFTDDPISPGATTVKAIHFNELRTAVNAVRGAAGLPSVIFTDTLQLGVPIRATHLEQLRTSLDAARAAIGLPPVIHLDPVVTSRTTSIRAAHVAALRLGVK